MTKQEDTVIKLSYCAIGTQELPCDCHLPQLIHSSAVNDKDGVDASSLRGAGVRGPPLAGLTASTCQGGDNKIFPQTKRMEGLK